MIGLGVPNELSSLVRDIAAIEDGDETRWRYEAGRKPKYRQASFTEETVVPMGGWQTRLEDIRAKHLFLRMGQDDRPDTLAEVINYELQALAEAQDDTGQVSLVDP